MKYRGTLETKDGNVEVFEFEEISRAKATQKMRDILRENTSAGVVARLFELHRSDADFICKWTIDSNLIICESFLV